MQRKKTRCAATCLGLLLTAAASSQFGLAPQASALSRTPTAAGVVGHVTFESRERYLAEHNLPPSYRPGTSALPSTYRASTSGVPEPRAGAAPASIPPPGPAAHWYDIELDASDLAGRHVPTRLGDGNLGFLHYASAHELYALEPLYAALQTHTPDVVNGNHLEYVAYLTDPSTARVYATVRLVAQYATTTADGVYTTPDGAPIGTITAYCDGTPGNVCPRSVDQNASY